VRTRSTTVAVSRLGVVVPARNEREYLAGCLAALDRAAHVIRIPLEVVVVLDSCVDDSEAVARAAARTLACRVHVVTVDASSVGTARRVGVQRLLEILDPVDDWVATTDADSLVPRSWFRRQLAHRAAGAAMVAGTVHVPEWEDRSLLRPRWERQYLADGHRHVHGANLSFQASAYLRVGGFADVMSDEDVRLVAAFLAAGEDVVFASDLSVATSARRDGRAPNGFAHYLNHLAGELNAPVPQLEHS
jgi:glycosyltransferase involved in cell wall biosynthesis